MQRRLLFLVNPVSGTKSKEELLETIRSRISAESIPYSVLHTNAEAEYNYLREKIHQEEITDVIVCGGDGTVNQVANAVRETGVAVGIIPMGSGNGLALAAKIPRNHQKALDIILRGNSQLIDAMQINEAFSCMLCGLGFDAQVAHDFAKQSKRGLMTYIRQTIRNFFSATPYPFNVWIEGRSFSTEAFFISIANSNQFGNNFTIAPKASLSDGLLDIVIVTKMSKMRLVWSILKQIKLGQVRVYEDKKYHRNEILYFQTPALKIENLLMAPLHIDGEPVSTAAEFDINIIPGAIRLLVP